MREISEGGFQTRPYKSRFFFAPFAFFAANTPNPNLFLCLAIDESFRGLRKFFPSRRPLGFGYASRQLTPRPPSSEGIDELFWRIFSPIFPTFAAFAEDIPK